MKMSRPGALLPAIALSACLTLTACGSDDTSAKDSSDDKAPAKSGASLDGAKAVVLDYLVKGFSGDAAACEHESADYNAAQNEEMGAADCVERVESIKPMLTDGKPLVEFDASALSARDGDDGTAIVDLKHEEEGFYATYHLKREGDRWVIVAQLEAEGPDAGDDSNPDARQVSEEEAVELAEAFCAVETGATRSDIEAILGEPTSEKPDDDGTQEVDWFVNEDSYTVWFDDADQVAQFSFSTPREDDPCAV